MPEDPLDLQMVPQVFNRPPIGGRRGEIQTCALCGVPIIEQYGESVGWWNTDSGVYCRSSGEPLLPRHRPALPDLSDPAEVARWVSS